MRIGAFYVGREVFLNSVAHYITAMTIQFAVIFNMAFIVIGGHVHSCFTLGYGRGSQVGRAFDKIEFWEELVIQDEPCQSHARSQSLGEGAGVNNEVFRIHGNERSDFFAFETEIAVGVIFEYRNFIPGYDFHELFTAFQAHAAAGRVLIVRNDVDEFNFLFGSEDFFQFFRNDAVIIGGNFDIFRLFEIKSADSAEVRRAFAENNVTFVQEYAAGNIETLLGTGNDHDVLRIYLFHAHGLVHTVHAVSNSLTETHETKGRTILHSAGAIFFSNFDSDFGQFFQRESLRCRKAAGERNDIRLSGQSQQSTNVGRFHFCQNFRKTDCHKKSLLYYYGGRKSCPGLPYISA